MVHKISPLVLLIGFLLHCQPTTPSINKEQSESPQFETLFASNRNPEVSCYRIPAIITAQNGDLIAAIDERVPSCKDLKWSEDINIVMRQSKDNGQTWSEIRSIINYPQGISASDPSLILEETTGEIFLFFNYMDLLNEKDIYYLKYIKSKDHGQTWSEPFDITSQISKPSWNKDFKFITSGRGIQTKSGTLIHTMVNIENGLHLFKSEDQGHNWTLVDHPIKPGDESKVIELEDGSLMVNSRVAGAGARYVHRSQDQGRTWESEIDTTLTDPACNASIIRYTAKSDGADKNRLLFCNANSKEKRENLTLRISYDEGNTWTKGKTIYAGSAAYSSMTILQNGDIGIFFEKDNYTENVFTRVSLDWLTDGKDQYTINQSNE